MDGEALGAGVSTGGSSDDGASAGGGSVDGSGGVGAFWPGFTRHASFGPGGGPGWGSFSWCLAHSSCFASFFRASSRGSSGFGRPSSGAAGSIASPFGGPGSGLTFVLGSAPGLPSAGAGGTNALFLTSRSLASALSSSRLPGGGHISSPPGAGFEPGGAGAADADGDGDGVPSASATPPDELTKAADMATAALSPSILRPGRPRPTVIDGIAANPRHGRRLCSGRRAAGRSVAEAQCDRRHITRLQRCSPPFAPTSRPTSTPSTTSACAPPTPA